MLAYILFAFIGGYALFLLGLSLFMYFENQKFGDNQFTMKLLPPPPRLNPSAVSIPNASVRTADAVSDWTAVPDRSFSHTAALSAGVKTSSQIR